MADTLTPERRSALMARIGGKNTTPELAVRSIVHRMGYRFRLHGRGLPGRPDLVLRGHGAAIFVHGCFWHAHAGACRRTPKSRLDYWVPKLEENRARDRRNVEALIADGWRVLTVWECELKRPDEVRARIADFLAPSPAEPWPLAAE